MPERIGIKIWDLRYEARDELYAMIDKHYKKRQEIQMAQLKESIGAIMIMT